MWFRGDAVGRPPTVGWPAAGDATLAVGLGRCSLGLLHFDRDIQQTQTRRTAAATDQFVSGRMQRRPVRSRIRRGKC